MIFFFGYTHLLFYTTQSHTQRSETASKMLYSRLFSCLEEEETPTKVDGRKVQNLHRQYNKARNLTGSATVWVFIFSRVMATAAAVVGGRHRHLPQ